MSTFVRQPAIVALSIPGPQGPQGLPGIQGAPGVNGYAKRFGTIDYTDTDAGTPFVLPAGEWVRLTRNLTPSAA